MVAASAAGNTCGAAPDADLVVVKVDYFNFDEMMLAYGIDFIKKSCRRTPTAIHHLLSYLPKGGAKDGETGILAQILKGELDANLGGGLLKGIVAVAGNENYEGNNPCRDENNRMHVHKAGTASFDSRSKRPKTNLLTMPVSSNCGIRSRTHTAVKLISPSGTEFGPVSPDARPLRQVSDDGFVMISNNRNGMEKWGAVRIILRDNDSLHGCKESAPANYADGTWKVEMSGDSGVWHGYVTYLNPPELTKAISRKDHTNQFKIRSGGNVRDVVTVGSINNGVVSWRDLFGSTTDYTSCYDPDEISHFSSRGPTKAGVNKPDIYTEGAWIKVAVSKDVTIEVNDPRRRKTLHADEYFIMEEGTSFAAPRVAGAIALMVAERQRRLIDA